MQVDLLGQKVCICSALVDILNYFPKQLYQLTLIPAMHERLLLHIHVSSLILSLHFTLIIVLSSGKLHYGFNFYFPVINFYMFISHLDILFY